MHSGPRRCTRSPYLFDTTHSRALWAGRLGAFGAYAYLSDTTLGQRGTIGVAAWAFAAWVGVGVDGGGRVQGEAASGKAPWCLAYALGRIAQQAPDAASGGDGALDGGGGETGQDGLLVAEWIGVAVVEHAAALEQADETVAGLAGAGACEPWEAKAATAAGLPQRAVAPASRLCLNQRPIPILSFSQMPSPPVARRC
jgi:hypothetical protein